MTNGKYDLTACHWSRSCLNKCEIDLAFCIIGASDSYDTSQMSQADTGAGMAAMDAQKTLKIGWIGAGSINFGSLEGPWNHAARLQKQNGVQFTAIVEPNVDVAQVRRLLHF